MFHVTTFVKGKVSSVRDIQDTNGTLSYRREQRCKSIISATRQLYIEKGVRRTSVRDITERAKCARSLFYHYYSGKDELNKDMVSDYVDSFIAAISLWCDHYDSQRPKECIEEFVSMMVKDFKSDDPLRIELFKPENAKLLDQFKVASVDTFARFMVEYGANRGIVSRFSHEYEAIRMIFMGLVEMITFDEGISEDVLAETYEQLIA